MVFLNTEEEEEEEYRSTHQVERVGLMA